MDHRNLNLPLHTFKHPRPQLHILPNQRRIIRLRRLAPIRRPVPNPRDDRHALAPVIPDEGAEVVDDGLVGAAVGEDLDVEEEGGGALGGVVGELVGVVGAFGDELVGGEAGGDDGGKEGGDEGGEEPHDERGERGGDWTVLG